MGKTCFKCKQTKPVSEFYRHPQMGDGHLGKCKACARKDVSVREHKLRGDAVWVAKERERCRQKQNRYRQLGLAKPTTQATRLKWAKQNREKIMAHKLATSAFKKGFILKPKACNRCGATGIRLEKHHEDYSRPLAVEWLCSKCHGKTRRKDDYEDIIP